MLAAYSENPQLGVWVTTQREFFKKGEMDADRIHRLEELGFVWDQNYFSWDRRYLELNAYRDEYGNCNVPQLYKQNPQLGLWVSTQRTNYMKGKLDDEYICQLEDIGFVWDVKTASWDQKFFELKAYKDNFGDCKVSPRNKNNDFLGLWVQRQRKSYKKGKLDPERILRLEEIGFDWNPRKKDN